MGGVVRWPWFGSLDRGRVLEWAELGAGERQDSLYSARALELDGVADYVLVGDQGALDKAVARITYQALRGVGDSQPRFRLNSGLDLAGPSLIRAGVWEEGEVVLDTPTTDLGQVWLGRSGVGYFNGQLANVRFLAADGEVLGRWLLNEHPAGSVNGLPALDSSGNGQHGAYVGGVGVTGLGVPADFRGLAEYGEYMWFSSLQNNWLTNISAPGLSNNAAWELDADVYFSPTLTAIPFILSHTSVTFGYFYQLPSTGGIVFHSAKCTPNNLAIVAPRSAWYRLRLSFDGDVTYSFRVNNGAASTLTLTNPLDPIPLNETLRISLNTSMRWSGAFRNIKINNTLIATGRGTTSADWGGGTVNGNPATIAEYRRTPPQVGMGSWNALTNLLLGSENFSLWPGNTISSITTFSTLGPFGDEITASRLFKSAGTGRTINQPVSGVFPRYTYAWVRASEFGEAQTTAVAVGQSISGTTLVVLSGPGSRTGQTVTGLSTSVWSLLRLTNTNSGNTVRALGPGTPSNNTSAGVVVWRVWETLTPEDAYGRYIPTFTTPVISPTVVSSVGTQDSVGNPIQVPRPTPTAFHSPGTDLYLRTDRTQVRSLSLWFYHSGVARTLFTNANLTLSVDDQGTVATTSGTLETQNPVSLGWNFVHINLPSPTDLTDFRSSNSLVDRILLYDQTLTADQIDRNRRAQQEPFS